MLLFWKTKDTPGSNAASTGRIRGFMKQFAMVLCLAVMPTLAMAQSGELWFSAGASLLKNNGIGTFFPTGGSEDDVELSSGFRFGFRFTFNNEGFFGHEAGYAYSRTKLQINITPVSEQGMAIHQGMYNFLVYFTPDGTRVRPFVTVGGHFANFVPPGSSATSGGGDNKFGFNYGAGIKARVTGMWAIRADLRQYHTGKPFDLPQASGLIRQTEVSAGFGVVF